MALYSSSFLKILEVELGYVRLKARVSNPIDRSKYIDVELLADTRAL